MGPANADTANPRHHALVLPLVAALEQHCDVLELAGPIDHRAHGHGGARPGWSSGAWAFPGSAAQRAALGLLVPDIADRVRLTVGGRPLWALAETSDAVQLDFAEVCDGATSTGDLLELADRYRTLVLEHVPRLSQATPDARRRFGNLVDVMWDRDVRLVVLAAGPPAQVLDDDLTDSERMRSRLHLLQVRLNGGRRSLERAGRRRRASEPQPWVIDRPGHGPAAAPCHWSGEHSGRDHSGGRGP